MTYKSEQLAGINRETTIIHGQVAEAGSFTIPEKSVAWGFSVTGASADVNGQTFPAGYSENHGEITWNYPAVVINNVTVGAVVYYWYVQKS